MSLEAADSPSGEGELEQYDDFEGSQDAMSRVRYWLRQESDHQWLSMGVFVAVIFVIALIIQKSAITPGLTSLNMMDSDTRVLDIEWNEEGTSALMIVEGTDGKTIQKWSDGELSTLIFDTPRSIERTSNGWIVGGDDGLISRCLDPCDILGQMSLDWQNDSKSGLRIIDVSSDDGVKGFILLNSYQGSSTDSNGTAGDRGGGWLTSVRYFENDVLSPAAFFESDQQMNEISGTSNGAISAGYGWFGLSSASNYARGVISTISGEVTSKSPEITVRHIGAGEYHSIIMHDNTSTIVGLSDVVSIDESGNLTTISGSTGATAAAMDGSGNIWLAGDFGSGSMVKIPCGSSEADLIQVSKITLVVDVGATRGDNVEFHGANEEGFAAVQFDSSQAETLYSLDYLTRVVFVFVSCSIFAVMLWSVRDKIKNY